ncbi:HEAT repeat domain-containing protein [Membranihabitans maritimus]|uniref:HEAT repeat domain-containing protein n=1 Tax=Membranihabitans maritimus TaxID=2904244 RepID=UPI001F432C51|nr:HEAT repeat domain-containing protein [Membranihabitans maritimus]
MGFYDLSKEERSKLVKTINRKLKKDLRDNTDSQFIHFYSDEDTYIRKAAYLETGKLYLISIKWRNTILKFLHNLFESGSDKIRQTVINASGEIGKSDFSSVEEFFAKGLFDSHHRVRNAVIGSIKKMGQKNPLPVLNWANQYLLHPDKEIRREICHGIELRGRTHPQDILPMLKKLQNDPTSRVRNTLVHVLGQISYKKGCLETVIKELNSWENRELVTKAIDEIISVHGRYKDFAFYEQKQAIKYISKNANPEINNI